MTYTATVVPMAGYPFCTVTHLFESPRALMLRTTVVAGPPEEVAWLELDGATTVVVDTGASPESTPVYHTDQMCQSQGDILKRYH
jgi:hypothetical protein